MKLKLLIFNTLFLVFFQSFYAQELRFDQQQNFRIVQFTDTHIVFGKKESLETISLIKKVISTEKPNLVFLTGDLVTGEPAKKGWEMLLETLQQTKTPFAIVLGNHDAEQKFTRAEIAKLVTLAKNNLNVLENNELGDFVLEIKSYNNEKTTAILYGLDSHDYSTLKKVDGYGWFKFKQIDWYREKSDFYKSKNNDQTLPALAFFHIPLPEYKIAFDKKDNKHFGKRLEDECPANINSGMFASFVEKGDVFGTFVGHDHNNDYITSLYDVALAYGRFSGSKNTYTDTQKGARVIDLKQNVKGFKTYMVLEDGSKTETVSFPDDFK